MTMIDQTREQPDAALGHPRRLLVLAMCCMSPLIVGLMGLLNPPITNTAVSGMPRDQAGAAAAISSTSRQVGMTLGVAVIGSISGGTLAATIGKSLATATHPGWWIIVGLGVLIVIGALVSTGASANETA
jgi:hypothetical protein